MKQIYTVVTALIVSAGLLFAGCDSVNPSVQGGAAAGGPSAAANPSQQPGNPSDQVKQAADITVGGDVSVWDSGLTPDPDNGIIPVGGSGQVNGEFTIAERDDIQIALRAQERHEGTLEASGNKVGMYEAETGFSGDGSDNTGTWNFDWHIDLRDSDYTLGDFDVTLHITNINNHLFGFSNPADLTFGGFIPDHTVLFQSSQNPGFGNDVFDPLAEGTYTLRLKLSPKDGGPPLAVTIRVVVSDPS